MLAGDVEREERRKKWRKCVCVKEGIKSVDNNNNSLGSSGQRG